MKSYWLTPVEFCADRTIMPGERIELGPEQDRERFLALVKAVHSRMLVPFKANLLLSEEAELACGVDELPFDLSSSEEIAFDERLALSHCALAYIDRLPSASEMSGWLQTAAKRAAGETGAERIAGWLHMMNKWNEQGLPVMLLVQ
ncbi:hypothetical protein N0M98_25360 [Paenibacillus doosanensis]|uniref:Uncharacterized protein n=1 Tax=Paenibacillus konkukensis TaxID=2020716 RepID=A0ABY4RYY9_9BACL|nr:MULTISPECIES: hypothetical protein [Paenibacillus]MCS7463439.1 hypothetical protein [Paenibacillus doosanensis]UQZ87025.1 hypothetical protein SK3146_06318 [Paenibacillus konkukensis]